MSYSTEVLADSPVCYYRLGEASGTTAADDSGNEHDGTYAGSGVTYGAAGAISDGDDAVTFASGGRVDTGLNTEVQPQNSGNDPFSIELWLKHTTSGLEVACGHRDANNWWIGFNGGKATFSVSGSGGARTRTGTTNINDGNWHHIVAVRHGIGTGGGLYLYVDGTLEGSDPGSPSTTGGQASNLIIGDFGAVGGFQWTGSIDEFAFYHGELSETRVDAHFAAASGGGGGGFHPAWARYSNILIHPGAI